MTNDMFIEIPGICEISCWVGMEDHVIEALIGWIDGDSSLGDCVIGYDEFDDTYTGTFTDGTRVVYDFETGTWNED